MDVQEVERVVRERGKLYGHPSVNFSNIAQGWEVILGVPVSSQQVALCMMWLKICREANKPTDDNLVDIVGYAICYDMLHQGDS